MDFNFQINSKGYLITRESFDLEYKQSFHFGDSLFEYIRSMVGMSNNRGGLLIFGIQNSPRIPIGLKSTKFQEFDNAKINQSCQEYFSHDFEWEIKSIEFNGLEFGQIRVNESLTKPITCRKSYKDILREGAIYYRYRGETKEIKFSELSTLLENEQKKERLLWINHIEKISKIGPENIHLMDTYRGEIHLGKEKVLIDSTLLDKIKFVKQGQFVNTGGDPTLTLAGEITGILEGSRIIPTDKAYPYRSSQIEQRFHLNRHQVKCLLWKLNIKNNPKYHDPIKIGKNSYTHKYSEAFIDRLDSILQRYPGYVEKACREYQSEIKKKTKKNTGANKPAPSR